MTADDLILEAEREVTFSYVWAMSEMDSPGTFDEAQDVAVKMGRYLGKLAAQEGKEYDAYHNSDVAIPDWLDGCPFSYQERLKIEYAGRMAYINAYVAEMN